jgi:hypothetical protein
VGFGPPFCPPQATIEGSSTVAEPGFGSSYIVRRSRRSVSAPSSRREAGLEGESHVGSRYLGKGSCCRNIHPFVLLWQLAYRSSSLSESRTTIRISRLTNTCRYHMTLRYHHGSLEMLCSKPHEGRTGRQYRMWADSEDRTRQQVRPPSSHRYPADSHFFTTA